MAQGLNKSEFQSENWVLMLEEMELKRHATKVIALMRYYLYMGITGHTSYSVLHSAVRAKQVKDLIL